jgi:hypothetical protein
MGFGVVEAGKASFHYPNFSSFPAFNQEKLGLTANAFVLVKAVPKTDMAIDSLDHPF